ncbi:MAG: hypothetical protein IPN27_11845 [Cellvibrionales bacterium]|jgi:hypothetical protein|nr:hypothetical protein [Cellvibrionales bacterium]
MKHLTPWGQVQPVLCLSPPKAKPRRRKSQPVYQQGDLDGLCGLYSLVNATNHLRGPLSKQQSSDLLRELAVAFHHCWGFHEAVVDGINGFQLHQLIRDIVIPTYQLVCKKPFHSLPHACPEWVWRTMMDWTDSGGVIILGTEEHWTVIEKVMLNSVLLRDSSDDRWQHKNRLLHKNPQNQRLRPQHLYFLKREEDMA